MTSGGRAQKRLSLGASGKGHLLGDIDGGTSPAPAGHREQSSKNEVKISFGRKPKSCRHDLLVAAHVDLGKGSHGAVRHRKMRMKKGDRQVQVEQRDRKSRIVVEKECIRMGLLGRRVESWPSKGKSISMQLDPLLRKATGEEQEEKRNLGRGSGGTG